jgi:LPXTG-motif cell wall-anchored protein
VYPKNMSSQIASAAKVAVPTTAAATTEEYKTAEVSATDESGNTAALDTTTYTAPAATPAPEPTPAPAAAEVAVAPEPTPAPAPEPTPEPVPAQLPQTGSSVPLIGLAGLLSLAAYFVVRPARVR